MADPTRPLDPLPDDEIEGMVREIERDGDRIVHLWDARAIVALVHEVAAVRAARAGRDATPDACRGIVERFVHALDLRPVQWIRVDRDSRLAIDARAALAGRDARATPEPARGVRGGEGDAE